MYGADIKLLRLRFGRFWYFSHRLIPLRFFVDFKTCKHADFALCGIETYNLREGVDSKPGEIGYNHASDSQSGVESQVPHIFN